MHLFTVAVERHPASLSVARFDPINAKKERAGTSAFRKSLWQLVVTRGEGTANKSPTSASMVGKKRANGA
jgi:hypothetical protein